jgi:DNA-binding CsgD family transcriptional regulator
MRGSAPLLLVSGVVVLVVRGLARGVELANLHNGLLALAFTVVGAYVLFQRPGHGEGRLFLATGAVEAVLFYGRQLGHSPTAAADRWWGWLGVWPTAIALALTTVSVLCFPDGRLPSPRWRWGAGAVVLLTAVCAGLSALWPVEYGSTGVVTAHPFSAGTPATAWAVWSAVAHPVYAALQVLWVLAVVVRWRSADGHVRRQLGWLACSVAVSAGALLLGLAVWGTPRPGLLAAALVPVVAGWAVVHGQHVAAYSALTWLSRSGPHSADLPTDLARATAEALGATGATLWMGDEELHPIGVWPEPGRDGASTTPAAVHDAEDRHTRRVCRNGEVVGALSIDRARADHLSLAESRLFDDLASQASLVIGHIGLAEVIARHQRAGHLDGLSPREREVLELIARGRSNAAISEELHLSIKTVEPVVSTIFTKLGLHPDAGSNRRVLAALAYLRP